MPTFFRSHWTHHWRFYLCLLLGVLVFALAPKLPLPERALAIGDTFFIS